jgi:hypothetical protein
MQEMCNLFAQEFFAQEKQMQCVDCGHLLISF